MSVSIEATVDGQGVDGQGETLEAALVAAAVDCERRAENLVSTVYALRLEADRYRDAARALNPPVGAPPSVDHQNDSEEGENDDGRSDDD